ncbi:hypothetical protein [Methyloterricola oryzae]|uniref:hypothetical protein n=1 Tax=Methyloterricola oryzae TaxID=1495050 RepID=UPI0005EBE447|nr:hypothetical protein [Methyloterricola oryzae]
MRNLTFVRSWVATLAIVLSALLPTSSSWAHGGASVDTDQCRIFVGPHLVHFTAYQPQLTGTTEYCDAIPELGPSTLVFDYEGKALRAMTVELEVTKEPEGTRVYYQEPSTHPSGTFNINLNFTEPSKYLAHVTLINEGQKVDAHVPFKVGTNVSGGGLSTNAIIILMVILVAGGYIFYLSNAQFKALIDGLLKKKSA